MNALKRLFVALFRGSDSGQSLVEYLIIVGACAFVGIAGFSRYGQSVKTDLGANARHIEGEGLPNTEGILGSLGVDYNELPGWCVKPNYCFAAGTPVDTERGERAIESIRVGDRIWARDLNTGAIALRPVVNTYRTPNVPVVDLELSAGRGPSEHLFVTRNHLFWVEGAGWLRADALATQPLWSTKASFSANLVPRDREPTTVYNLEVSGFHSYFVGHSHVLVHNETANDPSCPGGADGAAATPVPSARPARTRPPIECGEHGSYRGDLGGGRATPKQRRDADEMERDHIPSGAALATRAERIFDQMVDDQVGELCRDPTPAQREALQEKIAEYKKNAHGSLHDAVTDGAFATALPIPFHYETRSRGGRNQTAEPALPGGVYDNDGIESVKRYERDSEDLYAAAQADIQRYKELLGLDGASGEYTGELSDDCRERIEQALDKIRNKTDKQYEEELAQLARKKLKRDRRKLEDLVETNCPDPSVPAR